MIDRDALIGVCWGLFGFHLGSIWVPFGVHFWYSFRGSLTVCIWDFKDLREIGDLREILRGSQGITGDHKKSKGYHKFIMGNLGNHRAEENIRGS